MTAAEFQSIREGLGLSQSGLADKLGYASDRTVRRFESGDKPIPKYIAQLMTCYREH